MGQSINNSKREGYRNYGYNQNDLTDEITNTIEWLHENQKTTPTSTITAYLSLLYNLTSLVEDINEKRELYSTLATFENREKYQAVLHL